jgi:nitroreductase
LTERNRKYKLSLRRGVKAVGGEAQVNDLADINQVDNLSAIHRVAGNPIPLASPPYDAAFNQPKVEEAQAVLILLADKEGYYKEIDKILDDNIAKGYIPAEKKSQYIAMAEQLYGIAFAGRGFALRNTGLFAMGFMLAAKDFGVDTHPMDGFSQDKVKAAFNIPERYEVAMLIAVGYHDYKKTLLPRLNRKKFEDVVIKEGF